MFISPFENVSLVIFLFLLVADGDCTTTSTEQGDDKNVLDNPEETGHYFEGDIRDGGYHLGESLMRNGLKEILYRWPNAEVPYEVKGSFSPQQLAIISHAFDEYHTKTCVRFRKRSNERDYVVLDNANSGCWSSIGRKGGPQVVNLETPKCFSNYGTTIHELMHALGFYHEQNRYERDSYVRVLNENVRSGMMENFQKLPFSTATGFGVGYDYASVMHYKTTSFSKNGKPTLVALTSSADVNKMGQRTGFSEGDIKKINSMYKCL